MLRQLLPAITSTLVMMLLFGLCFPLLITVIAHVAFPYQADGSLMTADGKKVHLSELIRHKDGTLTTRDGKKVIGSALIAQGFSAPEYFHPRPSAAGSGYDATNSGGTNLGPTSDKLLNGIHNKLPNGQDDPGNFDGIKDLAAAYRKENGLAQDAALPADAVTRSGSGLDPQISRKNALLQVKRVASARKLPEAQVRILVTQYTQPHQLWVLGEPGVNVLTLNLALDARHYSRISGDSRL